MSTLMEASLRGAEVPTVLVIDDDAMQRVLTRRAIERCGMRVEEAQSGGAGLAACKRQDYEAVLLDVIMPGGLDGYEVCARLQALTGRPAPPVLIMTSLEDTSSVDEELNRAGVKPTPERVLWPTELTPGMTLTRDLLDSEGMLLLSRDSLLNEAVVEQLQRYEARDRSGLRIHVRAR